MEIWRKNKIKNQQKIKKFILKMKEEKEELKEKIGLMKSQVEKWKELKKIVET
jgi:hypothetical protein